MAINIYFQQFVFTYKHKIITVLYTMQKDAFCTLELSILLAGVWGHDLFAIISLVRINIDAKRKAKEEYKI